MLKYQHLVEVFLLQNSLYVFHNNTNSNGYFLFKLFLNAGFKMNYDIANVFKI